MATLSVQSVPTDGLEPSYASAASGGDDVTISRPAYTFLHVKNGDASQHTVTIASQLASVPVGAASSDVDVAVPASSSKLIALTAAGMRDGDDLVSLTYDAVTSVEVAVFEIA